MKVFGYPKSEGTAPRGVWRDLAMGGGVQGGRIQLDWGERGPLKGHSGGPVCDRNSGLMAGVLVEGSDAGHFDRMVPLPAIRTVWRGLPRPWLFAGQSARTHFTRRAAGQQSIAWGGDLFQGRVRALRAVHDWLCAAAGPGVPLVITGQPGAGKSAVLGRAALEIERTGLYDGVTFHARGAAINGLVDAMSAACDLDTPATWQELMGLLAERQGSDLLVLTVDAPDEAASDQDLDELRQALRELARLDWVRVAVATRPLAVRDHYRPGTHLHALGILAGQSSQNLIDLDSDGFSAAEDLTAYADALLAHDFAAHGPPGRAWEWYRHNQEARGRLAGVIADRARRNYLVAGISAFQLSEDTEVCDPASADFDPAVVPSEIGEALSKYLNRLPARRRRREKGLLSALAYGRGAGLDDKRWLLFASALGYKDITTAALSELKASAGADYLLETSTDQGMPVTRLFHQALADEILRIRHQRADESAMLDALLETVTARGWVDAPPYVCEHIAAHAAAAGRLDEVLVEPDLLLVADPAALLPFIPAARTDPAMKMGRLYQRVAHRLATASLAGARGDPAERGHGRRPGTWAYIVFRG